MDDILHDTSDVPILLRKVEISETSRTLVVVGVGLEDPAGLSLGTDDSLRMTVSFGE